MSLRPLAGFILLLAGVQSAAPAAPVPGAKDSVALIDTAGLQEVIKQHRGEALVINIWATWCVPCVEEIPDLIRLSRDNGVRVVGVSIDDPEDSDAKVVPFLKTHGVTYPVFVKTAGSDEGFINALNREWSGAVPVTFIYDRTGRQRTMLVGRQSYEALRTAVISIGER